ncbi:hypothetical protein CY35_02G076200 [Sphagnum magellanicum]|nr:hypothetical protein CY35_02G076200 [Sphagnum magellanicum]
MSASSLDNMEHVFEVGKEVEARFNEIGYRGAWFRCKILESRRSGEEWEYLLYYLDFTEENCTWTCACEPDPVSGLANKKNITWMIRPPMPLTLDEIEYQQWKEPGLVVVFNKDYRVGDMVDWWHDSCFWTGRILSMNAANNKVQITLLNPPQGEGKRYWAHPKDLRPALEWTMESDWIAVKPLLAEDVHRRRSVNPRCGQPRVQLMDKSSGASLIVAESAAHPQDSVIEDVSLQSQRCDQPAQGLTTEGSVIGEASRERGSCNGPTGELNIAVEPAKQSIHAIQPIAKRRYRGKKKRETTGELNISAESVTKYMDAIQPRAKRRYRVKKRKETTGITTGNAPKEKIQRKRKRAVCEDNTVCGKKQMCRTWTPNLREQNGKSSEDPEIRQNLEQANELIALNTKMFSAPSTPQHEEVRDTGKIWESDGHPQSGDTSMVSDEEKIIPENSGEADPVQNILVEDGKERPVQVIVVSEGEQAQVADEKTNLTITLSEGLVEAGAAAIRKFSLIDFPEELYDLERLSVRVQSMRKILRRKFGGKQKDLIWRVEGATQKYESTGAKSCEAVGVRDQESPIDLAPVQLGHAVQSSDQEHTADLAFVKPASEIECHMMNSNKIIQGQSKGESIQEAELELLELLSCQPNASEATAQKQENSDTGGHLKQQRQTEIDITDLDMGADASRDGFGELKAEFGEPVASAGEQSKGDSLQCPGIKLQPNGVGSVKAYSQEEAVSIGNYASLAEAGFAYESAAGRPPFPIAGTDASSGPVTNLDPSRRKDPKHKETIGLCPTTAQFGLDAANSSVDVTIVLEPSPIAQGTHIGPEGSSHLRCNETAERQTAVWTVEKESLVSVANRTGKPQPDESGLIFACSNSESVADATKPVVSHMSSECDAVLKDVSASNATGLETPPSLDLIKIRTFLDSIKMTGFATMKETEAAYQAHRTLLQTIFCTIDDSGASMDSIAGADMLVFFSSSVSYIDSDTNGSKVILRSRSGQRTSKYESIPIGLYKTLEEAEAACRAISHCRRELKKFASLSGLLQVVNLPQIAGPASILKLEAVSQVWRPCTSDSTLPPATINHGQCSIQAKAQPSRATITQASMHSPGNAKAGMGNRPCLTTSTVQTSRQTEAFDVVLTDTHASLQAKASCQVQVCKQASTHEIAPCTTPLNIQVCVPGGTPFVPGNVRFEPPPATLGAVITINNERECGTLPLPQPFHNQSTFLPANNVNTYVCCKTAVWPLDQILVRRLQCKLCNCTMHTACAIRSGQLRLMQFTRNGQVLEHVLYRCLCNYDSEVLFKLLAVIWHITTVIAKQQNRNRVRSAAGVWSGSVSSVQAMLELGYLMETLSRLELSLKGASRNLFKLHRMVSAMINYTKVAPDSVDYQRFVDWIAYHTKLAAGAARA